MHVAHWWLGAARKNKLGMGSDAVNIRTRIHQCMLLITELSFGGLLQESFGGRSPTAIYKMCASGSKLLLAASSDYGV